jgi:hypothetical protein
MRNGSRGDFFAATFSESGAANTDLKKANDPATGGGAFLRFPGCGRSDMLLTLWIIIRRLCSGPL